MAPKLVMKASMKAKAMKGQAAAPAKKAIVAASKAKAGASKRPAAAAKKAAMKSAAKVASKKNPKQEELWEVEDDEGQDEAELSPRLAPEVSPNMDIEEDAAVDEDGQEEPMGQVDNGAIVTPQRSQPRAAAIETVKSKMPIRRRRKEESDLSSPAKTAEKISQQKPDKKKKKLVDPNKPKCPVGGAYMVFLEENRAEIKASCPEGCAVTAVTKAASERWRSMDEEARTPYTEKYKVKFEAYHVAKEEYLISIGVTPPSRKPANGEAEEGVEGAAKEKPIKSGTPIPEELIDQIALKEVSGLGYETKFRMLIADNKFRHLPHSKILAALRVCGGRMIRTNEFLRKNL